MEIISRQGNPEVAEVFVARFRENSDLLAEFVDARDPELSADEKWVIIISTQFGCPIECQMCDAGGDYRGNINSEEMLSQIQYVVAQHDTKRLASIKKFKIQFARMGEPSLNPYVLNVLQMLPQHFNTQALIPCVATIAPRSATKWFDELLEIRQTVYSARPFQLQFSINSTDEDSRNNLMPIPKLSLKELGQYAKLFASYGQRKVALNFALAHGILVDPLKVAQHFDPASACIKLTPLNPTIRSAKIGLKNALLPHAPKKAQKLADKFKSLGFDVILSIGDLRENEIGSNCGMAVRKIRGKLAA